MDTLHYKAKMVNTDKKKTMVWHGGTCGKRPHEVHLKMKRKAINY